MSNRWSGNKGFTLIEILIVVVVIAVLASLTIPRMFVDPLLSNAIRVTIVNSGLMLPRILKSRMNNLQRDSGRHNAKKIKGDKLDFSGISSINIDEDFEISI